MSLADFWRVFQKVEREYDDGDEELLRARILRTRHRADVVAELPAGAPLGYLLVTPGSPFLYVGAGMSNPLRRIPTQAIP